MQRTIADIILSVIIGDAAGYTFNGMKKNHIKAVFREIHGYTDPAPALKDNMQRWKKPGLYSSISVNTLLAASCIDKKGFNPDDFISAVTGTPEVPGTEYGIFRDAGETERHFITGIKNGVKMPQNYTHPCSRILPPVIPLLLIKNEKEHLISAVRFISLFTRNSLTITCSAILLQLLKDLIGHEESSILKTALTSAEKVKDDIIRMQTRIFDTGLNPDYIITESEYMLNLFRELNVSGNNDKDNCERIICSHADKRSSDSITRGSINLPETILPLAAVIADSAEDPYSVIETAVMEGGSSSSLASIASAVATAYHGLKIPEIYISTIANKKRIGSMIDIIAEDRNRSAIKTEIYSSEPGLTAKELEEYRSRNKNSPVPKEKKKKTRSEIESGLSKHVVESWTKLDKAKWKKERNRDNS